MIQFNFLQYYVLRVSTSVIFNLSLLSGGTLIFSLNSTILYNLIEMDENNNHLYVVENYLRAILPRSVSEKCHLYSYITSLGLVSVVLEALEAEDHELCHTALKRIQIHIKFGYTVKGYVYGKPKEFIDTFGSSGLGIYSHLVQIYLCLIVSLQCPLLHEFVLHG